MIEPTLYRGHPAWSYFYGRFFFVGMSLLLASDEGQASAAFTLAIALILSVIYGRYRPVLNFYLAHAGYELMKDC